MSECKRNRWDRFWFEPTDSVHVARVRALLVLITIAYFASAWQDIDQWYSADAIFSTTHASTFLRVAGLEREAGWILSPLFLADSTWAYRGYLLLGLGVSLAVLLGRGGRVGGWLLWGIFVGWANRSMMLSSLCETLISLALFSIAIARPTSILNLRSRAVGLEDAETVHWSNRFSLRLLAVHGALVGFATFTTMLAGRVWWNGLGAFALAAPVEDRTIDWTQGILSKTLVHDFATAAILLSLPIGLVLLWQGSRSKYGIMVLASWCLVVAFLHSNWLYAATFAAMSYAAVDVRDPAAAPTQA